jgi:hypothetical protein
MSVEQAVRPGVFTRIVRWLATEPPTRPGLAGDHLNEMIRTGADRGRNPFAVGFEAALRGLLGLHVPNERYAAQAARGASQIR